MLRDLPLRLRILHRAWRLRLRADPLHIAFIRKNLRPGEVAVDVGSHKGGFTYWMRKQVGPGGMIYAFEPQPRSVCYQREVVRCLGHDNVVIEEKALSSRRGVAEFTAWEGGFDPGGRLGGKPGAGVTFQVAVETLDDYFAQARRPVALIKIDAEGHELEIFRGGTRILTEDRPHLSFECERRHHGGETILPVFDHLLALGYTGRFVLGNRLADLSEFDEERHQREGVRPYVFNFLFQHPARL